MKAESKAPNASGTLRENMDTPTTAPEREGGKKEAGGGGKASDLLPAVSNRAVLRLSYCVHGLASQMPILAGRAAS